MSARLEPPGPPPPPGAALSHFLLDPSVVFLNHGSFGACPRAVLEHQAALRARMEREPIRFLVQELEGLLDEARVRLAAFVGAAPADLAFVTNATSGVNAVLGSLRLEPGDELLTTDHGYNACNNALAVAAERSGARRVVARVPFPIAAPEQVVEALLAAASPRTRLVLVDHVTSPTGLVFPVERIVAAMAERGIDTLVDGAHAPGMVPLALDRIGAAYYTGNCHKWPCAPKGAAFLHVRADRQAQVRPTVISHGANSTRGDRSRFLQEFDWPGTTDPTAVLSIPAALEFMAGVSAGGWPALMAENRALAIAGRGLLLDALGVAAPAPASMLGSLATVPLPSPPGAPPLLPPGRALELDPVQRRLIERHRIQVPIMAGAWHDGADGSHAPEASPPSERRRVLRISAQVYNHIEQYRYLASAIERALQPG